MTDLPPLTALEVSRLLDGWASEWSGSTWDKPALVDACTGRSEAVVNRFLEQWVVDHPDTPPDVAWLSARIDSVDRAPAIAELRRAAHEALAQRQPAH